MTKLLVLAALVCLAVKLLTQRWPWELGQPQARSLAESRARNLLGVEPNAKREQIIEAHRRLLAMVHPDRGGSNEAVHEANAARDLLLARLVERR
ncbi:MULTISPECIES: DnaJ domain-containing protein [unclassified Sphingomonas]|uniref:DnaJ domain-containing protein n=1 Tax=Novosphingobium rhizosphaerae TaxID=1551649 RepID=UPI0015C9A706